jgi:hypothetical protein
MDSTVLETASASPERKRLLSTNSIPTAALVFMDSTCGKEWVKKRDYRTERAMQDRVSRGAWWPLHTGSAGMSVRSISVSCKTKSASSVMKHPRSHGTKSTPACNALVNLP